MGVRIFCCDARVLATTLTMLPSSVVVVGSISSPRVGEVALLLQSPAWPDREPMPEVEMHIDDRVALTRSIRFSEKTALKLPPKPKLVHADGAPYFAA